MYPHASQQADCVAAPHAEATDKNQVQTFALTAASQDLNLVTTLPSLARESHWVTFVADVAFYVRFKAATGGTTVTAGTGWPVAAGEKFQVWVRHGRDTVIEIIASTGTLKYYLSDCYGGPSPTSV